MNRNAAALLLALLLAPPVIPADTPASLESANDYRARWTIDNWDDGGALTRYVFLNMTEFWPHSVIHRHGAVRELAPTARQDVANFLVADGDGGRMRLAEVMADERIDGMLVLHEGRVVFEEYPRMQPWDKHLWMSVSKPVASTLVGILADRELIDVNEPVASYVPELAAGGWAEVPVIDVLDMASGIDCRQAIAGAYTDPETCYYQFEAALGWLPRTDATSADVHAFVASLPPARPPGEAFEYTSVNTFVLRWLVERVTGKPYATVVSEEIWQRMGAESDGLIVAPVRGIPVAASGISSTLRDMARFGLLFTPTGRILSEPVISDAMLAGIGSGGRPEIFNAGREADNPRRLGGEPALANSLQWDYVMEDGDFYKGGYGGQGLYVSPSRDLVIAFFGTLDDDGSSSGLADIARRLAVSGLFD